MRQKFTQTLLLVCMMWCASLGVQAQSSLFSKNAKRHCAETEQKRVAAAQSTTLEMPLRLLEKMEAQVAKSPALRRAAEGAETMDVVLLDSVISDTRREYYKYNDKGWLTSIKIYEWEDGTMQLDTTESYLLEYEFDELDRCTYYGEFSYNADGTKGQETKRVVITWTGSREHNEKYYAIPDDWDRLEPTAEISYDKYGNFCQAKYYDWDDEKKQMVLEESWEMKFTGNVMEYYYTEEGYPDGMDFDGELFDLHCYYYVDYNMNWSDEDEVYYELFAYKIDKTTDGLTTTKTRYEINLDDVSADVLNQLDSYWGFQWEEVITLTPSRNRYASVYFYERVSPSDDNVNYPEYHPGEDIEGKAVATRTTSEKELVTAYDFEWDEHERLVKYVWTDEEGDKRTYTCTYLDDEYRVITLADFEQAWNLYQEGEYDDLANLMRGGFYGKAHKERMEFEGGYEECINDEYDDRDKVLHYTVSEVYYSEEEVGEDLNGDEVISTEREEYNYEFWFNYDAEGNAISSIEYDDYREGYRAYTKYEYINEPSGNQYLLGTRVYWGASKEGPWTLINENIRIYAADPATDPNIESVGGWWRMYDYDFKTWSGNKWEIVNDSFVEYPIDPETGKFSTTGYESTARRSEELQEGFYEICFTEDGWEYQGYKNVGYVWDEQTETEVLKITDGEIRIFRAGRTNGAYHADDPADNYEFPVGIYFMGVESEDVATGLIDMIYLIWDRELETWRMMFGMATATTYRHYANEQGQIVNEMKTYAFNSDTERMELQSTSISSIYSFDECDRLSSVENSTSTTHYIYRNDECDYLLESYMTDNTTGGKYNVCKYYYSDGEYIFPYTDIEEVKAAKTWTINGTSVMADGQIVLYNMNGQIAAQGWGMVTAPQSGLYIVSFKGTRAKVWLR